MSGRRVRAGKQALAGNSGLERGALVTFENVKPITLLHIYRPST
jgi:hypothetical protein